MNTRKENAGVQASHDSHVFVSVRTQHDNLGDTLIVRELIRLLTLRTSTTVDLSRCPSEFRASLELEGIHGDLRTVTKVGFIRLAATLLMIRLRGVRPYYCLMPGGLGGEKSTTQAIRTTLYTFWLRALSATGARVFHMGVSYDAVGDRHARLLRSRARVLYSSVVRDHASAAHLTALGVPVDGVVPDIAFNLFSSAPTRPSSVRSLAFSFRSDKYSLAAGLADRFVARVREAHPESDRLVFVSQVRRDDDFMRALAARIADDRSIEVVFIPCPARIGHCASAYKGCSAIYSNRLHALLLAASVGCEPFAILDRRADIKILGIFEDLGLTDHVLSFDSTPEQLVSTGRIDYTPFIRSRERLHEYLDNLLK